MRLTHSGFAAHDETGRTAHDRLAGGWGGLLREELAEYLRSGTPARRHASTG